MYPLVSPAGTFIFAGLNLPDKKGSFNETGILWKRLEVKEKDLRKQLEALRTRRAGTSAAKSVENQIKGVKDLKNAFKTALLQQHAKLKKLLSIRRDMLKDVAQKFHAKAISKLTDPVDEIKALGKLFLEVPMNNANGVLEPTAAHGWAFDYKKELKKHLADLNTQIGHFVSSAGVTGLTEAIDEEANKDELGMSRRW